MTATEDRYVSWDAAYVLGALSPAERRDYETHLAECPSCRAAVTELAGMPGLLSQVPVAEAVALADGDQPTALPARLRRSPARTRVLLAVAAAALVVVGLGAGFALRALTTPPPSRVAFDPVTPSSLTAVADLAPDQGGTDIRVECQYGEAGQDRPTYAIWVVGPDRRATEVKPWTVSPNKVMHPSARVDLAPGRIRALEIRDAYGTVLLRAVLRR